MAVFPANLPTTPAGFHLNTPPADFDPRKDFPDGFYEFLLNLHRWFTPRQQALLAERRKGLAGAHAGNLPQRQPPSEATQDDWRIELPQWCQDQRNQMTGPGDDAELCVKMLNSGAPGVLLDFEDSVVNQWGHQQTALDNIIASLHGTLTYFDKKRNRTVAIQPSKAVIWIRPRGLHMSQGGVIRDELLSASLFDVARVAFAIDPGKLKHPLSFYIPKSESAEEALWWRDVFQAVAETIGLPGDYIKCMALVEAHPMAYQMEEFVYNLRDHIIGLDLGRWDYMASLAHFLFSDPGWVLPDRNTIPHDVPFFQNARTLLVELCHKRGILAVGGMTALYPSREDPELNARALKVLEEDKRNEANCLMDGAWTGHPDQNQIAVDQFPVPNQVDKRPANAERYPDLRPQPRDVGQTTVSGTRAAARTVIRYRNGVLNGKGASLLDGYMEDLATDRIYRVMLAQRMKHWKETPIVDDRGEPVAHTPEFITRIFDEELEKLIANPARADLGTAETFREGRRIGEAMILNGEFDPI